MCDLTLEPMSFEMLVSLSGIRGIVDVTITWFFQWLVGWNPNPKGGETSWQLNLEAEACPNLYPTSFSGALHDNKSLEVR
jgi:hypothetical protein